MFFSPGVPYPPARTRSSPHRSSPPIVAAAGDMTSTSSAWAPPVGILRLPGSARSLVGPPARSPPAYCRSASAPRSPPPVVAPAPAAGDLNEQRLGSPVSILHSPGSALARATPELATRPPFAAHPRSILRHSTDGEMDEEEVTTAMDSWILRHELQALCKATASVLSFHD